MKEVGMDRTFEEARETVVCKHFGIPRQPITKTLAKKLLDKLMANPETAEVTLEAIEEEVQRRKRL